MGCCHSIHAASANASAELVKPQPVTPDSRLLRGQAYFAAGKVQEALKELNATIASWPTYARAYLERGNIRLDQRDYSLAVGDYTMALQLQANLLQAYQMRCHARMALRQYPEALQDAREAEKLDPENAQVRALKAQVRKALAGSGPGGGGGGGGRAGGVGGDGGGANVSVCGSEEDAFAGFDTPKSTPSPSVHKLCMVCMDSERECRLRPCMHAALCVECAEGLRARGYGCPICSSKIEQVERGTFLRTFTVEEAQGIVASARVVSSATSPGKSPLGRRFAAGSNNAPSLDDIVEVDEEAHATGEPSGRTGGGGGGGRDGSGGGGGGIPENRRLGMQLSTGSSPGRGGGAGAAVGAGAGAGGRGDPERAVSSVSGVSSASGIPPPPPPVQLDPHPLSNRAARRPADGAEAFDGNPDGRAAGSPTAAAAAAAPPPPRPPPLPGAVEEEEVAHTAAAGRTARGSGGGGGANDGGGNAGLPSPGPLSPMASAALANSLADWIDERPSPDAGGGRPSAGGRPSIGGRPSTGAAGATAGGNGGGGGGANVLTAAATTTASRGSPQGSRRESFMGFSTPSSLSATVSGLASATVTASGTVTSSGAAPVSRGSSPVNLSPSPNASTSASAGPGPDPGARQSAGPVAESCAAASSGTRDVVGSCDAYGDAGSRRMEPDLAACRAVVGSVFFHEDPRLLGRRHQAHLEPRDDPWVSSRPSSHLNQQPGPQWRPCQSQLATGVSQGGAPRVPSCRSLTPRAPLLMTPPSVSVQSRSRQHFSACTAAAPSGGGSGGGDGPCGIPASNGGSRGGGWVLDAAAATVGGGVDERGRPRSRAGAERTVPHDAGACSSRGDQGNLEASRGHGGGACGSSASRTNSSSSSSSNSSSSSGGYGSGDSSSTTAEEHGLEQDQGGGHPLRCASGAGAGAAAYDAAGRGTAGGRRGRGRGREAAG